MTHEGEAGSLKPGCSCLPELPHHACAQKEGLISTPKPLLIFGGRMINEKTSISPQLDITYFVYKNENHFLEAGRGLGVTMWLLRHIMFL